MTANRGALLLARRRLHGAIVRGIDVVGKALMAAFVVAMVGVVGGAVAAWVFVEHPAAFAGGLAAVVVGGAWYGLALWWAYRRALREVERDA